LDEVKEISEGTKTFIKGFKPMALVTANDAKKLVVDEGDYSTPADHYFNYVQ